MKVGIYGGTFDPVHNGHVIIATSIVEKLKLDKLIITPAYIPPHKQERVSVDFAKRLKWVQHSFRGIKNVEISDFEGKNKEISYTFNTISHFEKIYGRLTYVMGEDSFLDIEKWYKYEQLIKKVELWVYPRYCQKEHAFSLLKRLEKFAEHVHFAEEFPLIQISSTLIRERIKERLPIRGYVSEGIEEGIVRAYLNKKRGNEDV